jgi:hypothetical protein
VTTLRERRGAEGKRHRRDENEMFGLHGILLKIGITGTGLRESRVLQEISLSYDARSVKKDAGHFGQPNHSSVRTSRI